MAIEVAEKDVVSILDFFNDLKDPRSAINRKHLLSDIVVICVAAILAGCDGPRAIGKWAQAKNQWCRKYLKLPNGIPSHDTIGRVLATLDPTAFQACFNQWITHVRGSLPAPSSEDADQLNIDGKALRGSHDRRNSLGALFLVSAWSVRNGISMGQIATEAKSNEITAIPELIDSISIQGTVVSIDAAGCQKNIARKIIEKKGDYLLALKGNQGKFHQRIVDMIDEQFETDWAIIPRQLLETSETKHGREDFHSYIQFAVPETLIGREQWAGLKSIGIAIRTSLQNGIETIDNRYYLLSLKPNVKQFASLARNHWSIENTLHWCLDVTFREDESRLRDRIAAQNVAWLKRFAIGLIKQNSSKESIAMQRRMAGWNDDYLTQLLGLPRT